MDTDILEGIGLTKAEIKVYVALLELGQTTSGKIIEKSGLQSSVVHRVLKSLTERGLVSYVKIVKDRHYQAASPTYLLMYIEEKRKGIEKLIPLLVQRQKAVEERLETEMVVGKKAIFSLLLNLIADAKPKEEYLSFSLTQEHEEEDVVLFYKNFNVRRWERKLNVKVLGNIAVKPIFEKNYPITLLRKTNLKYTTFNFPQGIIIFRNKTIFLNWEKTPTAVVITSSHTAEQFRRFFYDLYNREKLAY